MLYDDNGVIISKYVYILFCTKRYEQTSVLFVMHVRVMSGRPPQTCSGGQGESGRCCSTPNYGLVATCLLEVQQQTRN